MRKIDCEVFKTELPGTGAFVRALDDLNKWRDANPSLRVINVETIMSTSGGESTYGSAVKMQSIGLRVWFETA